MFPMHNILILPEHYYRVTNMGGGVRKKWQKEKQLSK